jgi:hypothetical protein
MVFRFWNFGATDPGDRADWGTADLTQTDDPEDADYDSGTYAGLVDWANWDVHTVYDNFYANSEAAP